MTLEGHSEARSSADVQVAPDTGSQPDRMPDELRLTELLLGVALTANEGSSSRRALARTLDLVRDCTRWEVGHAYLVDERGALVTTGIWRPEDPERRAALRRAAEAARLGPGGGLPGVVRQTGRPVWVADVTRDPRTIRRMADIGLRAALALPILSGPRVVGVLEFFAAEPATPHAALLEVMAGVGAQIGRVIERERAERALRASEEKLSTIIRLAPSAIISLDASRTIRMFNRSAEEIFGYSAREVVGRPLEVVVPDHRTSLRWPDLDDSPGAMVPDQRPAFHGVTGRRSDGDSFEAEVSIAAIRIRGEVILTLVLSDVSERVEAERRRDRAISLLRATLEATADGILAMNDRGELEGYNQRFLDLWEIPRDPSSSVTESNIYAAMLERVLDFDAFRTRLTGVMGHPDAESEEVFELVDGRLLEGRSIPRRVERRCVGRVWSFRDVTPRSD